ncbi:MAG: T9SS type A sorting domain-containing protein [Melioribacteraceae bacterium]|nr:T9SS type A sorting domain-containing protein [Melioribacteraceae bacterium]MDD3559435.1 T9SS type A sorting domain-containing protein [Melioribacteraceae bacterium]
MRKSFCLIINIIFLSTTFLAQSSFEINIPETKINNDLGYADQQPNDMPISNSIYGNSLFFWKDFRNGTPDTYVTNKLTNASISFCKKWLPYPGVTDFASATDSENCIYILYKLENELILSKCDSLLNEILKISIDVSHFHTISNRFNLAINRNNEIAVVVFATSGFVNINNLYGIRFNTNLESIDSFKRLISCPYTSDLKKIEISVTSDNNFAVLIFVNEFLFIQVFRETLLLPLNYRVNAQIKSSASYKLAASDSGSTFGVAFLSEGLAGSLNKTYFQKFWNSGIENGDLIEVTTEGSLSLFLINFIDDEYLIGFEKLDINDVGRSLYCQILQDDNSSYWSEELKINSTTNFRYHFRPEAVKSGTDKINLIWLSEVMGYPQFFYNSIDIFTRDFDTENMVCSNEGSGYQFDPDIISTNNKLLVVWNLRLKIPAFSNSTFFRSLDFQQQPGLEVKISGDTSFQGHPPKIVKTNNRYIISRLAESVFAQEISEDGLLLNKEVDIAESNFDNKILCFTVDAILRNRLVYIWWDNDQIYGQIMNSDLEKLVETTIFQLIENVTNIKVLLTNDDNIFILWQTTDQELFLKKFDFDLQPLTNEMLVVIRSLNSTINFPAITYNKTNGDVITTWIDNSEGDNNVYARIFDSNCEPKSELFLVNDDNAGVAQENTTIASDSDGKFVISWTDSRNGSKDIYAQLYYPNYQPFDSNFLINSHTLRTQHQPSVYLENGLLSFAWSSNHLPNTGYDVFVKQYYWNAVVGIANINQNNSELIISAYPNPSNSETTINFSLPSSGFVNINIYNLLGEKVRSLVNSYYTAGNNSIILNTTYLPSGTYFCRINFNDHLKTIKLIILK